MSRKKILAAIKAEEPAIIEVGDPYRAAWIGLSAAQQNNIPIVAFYHSDYPRALDRDVAQILRRIHRVPGFSTHQKVPGQFVQPHVRHPWCRAKRCHETLKAMGIGNLQTIALGTNLEVFYPRRQPGVAFSRN